MQALAITGLGAVVAGSQDWASLGRNLVEGRRSFSPWPEDCAPPRPDSQIGRVVDLVPHPGLDIRDRRHADRAVLMSTRACGEALEQAGSYPNLSPQVADGCATIFATARTEYSGIQRFAAPLLNGSPDKLNPSQFPYIARNVSCGQVCLSFGLRGMSSNLSAGALSSADAVLRAAQWLREGRAPLALVCAVESLSRLSLMQDHILQQDAALQPPPPAEGAASLLIEPLASAMDAGKPILALLHGGLRSRTPPNVDPASWQADRIDALLQQHGVKPDRIAACFPSNVEGMPAYVSEAAGLAAWQKRHAQKIDQPSCLPLCGVAGTASTLLQFHLAIARLQESEHEATTNRRDYALISMLDPLGGYACLLLSAHSR